MLGFSRVDARFFAYRGGNMPVTFWVTIPGRSIRMLVKTTAAALALSVLSAGVSNAAPTSRPPLNIDNNPSLASKMCNAGALGTAAITGYEPRRAQILAALRDQMAICYAALITMVAPQNYVSPAKPLTAGQVDLCNPKYITAYDNPTVIATLITNYCGGLLSLRRPAPFGPQATAGAIVYSARNPTIYVISNSAAPASSSGTMNDATTGSGATGYGAPVGYSAAALGNPVAPTSTTPYLPTGSITNADGYLEFLIARAVQDKACQKIGATVYGATNVTALFNPEAKGESHCDQDRVFDAEAGSLRLPGAPVGAEITLPVVAVVPERNWTMEDFRQECAGDPYVVEAVNGKTTAHGTLGAIVIDGTVRTEDGTFHIVTVGGKAEASYSAEVLSCNDQLSEANGQTSGLENIYSQKIAKSAERDRPSLWLPGLAFSIYAANQSAKAAFIPLNTSSPPAAATEAQFSNSQVSQAVASYAAASSSLITGNPNSSIALKDADKLIADKVASTFDKACSLTQFQMLPICLRYRYQPISDPSVPK